MTLTCLLCQSKLELTMHLERLTGILYVVFFIFETNLCSALLIPDITANLLEISNNSLNSSIKHGSSMVYAEVEQLATLKHSFFTKLSEARIKLFYGLRSHSEILIEDRELFDVIEAVVVLSEKQLCASALRQKIGPLVTNLSSRIQTKIKIGVGYSHTLAECAHLSDPELMQHVSLLVVQVDFGERQSCLPESYSLFVDFMLQLRTKMTKQIYKGERSVADVEIIYKLSLESVACFPNRNSAILEAYQGVLATFSETFASEANMSIIVDQSILKWSDVKDKFSEKNRDPLLIPALNSQLYTDKHESSYPSVFAEVPPSEYRKHKCSHYLPDVLQLIRKLFLQLFVTAFQWADILECVEQGYLSIITDFDTLIVRIFSLTNERGFTEVVPISWISKLISTHLEKLSFMKLQINFLVSDLTWGKSYSVGLTNLISAWKMNVSFVGELPNYKVLDSDEEGWLKRSLNELLTNHTLVFQTLAGVYWSRRIVLRDTLNNDIDVFWKSARPELEKLLELVNNFRRDHPQKAVGIRLFMTFRNMNNGPFRSNVYCEGSTTRLSKFVDAVANWGRLNNVTLILNEVISYINDAQINRPGWLNILRFPKFLKWPKHLEFTNGYFPGKNGFSMVKTCIPRTVDVAPFGVQFPAGRASATLNLTAFGKPLLLKEIELMLRFTFHKFDTVELIIGNNGLEYAKMLSHIFRTLKLFEVGKGDRVREIFVEISISEMESNVSRSADVINALNAITGQNNVSGLIVRGIHVKVDDESDFGAKFRAVGMLATTKVVFGITLRDCVDHVNCFNSKCANHSILHDFAYVVCDLPRMPPSNENGVLLAETLEGLLYVHRILKRFVPELKVIFRLNINNHDSRVSQRYLALINEVQSFSSMFKVDFFLVSSVGFANDNVSNWWEVDPVGDLADQNAYGEVESRYLNRSSWRPFKVALKSEQEVPFSKTALVIIGVTLGLVACVFIFGYTKLCRHPKRITAKKLLELLGLSGDTIDGDEEGGKMLEKLCMKRKDLEIDWDDVVGAGVFGKVYKATFNEQLVAVKVPTSHDVRGASFRSVVAELKVLCRLGNHDNVVDFLGAYTMEIKQGKLYVITSFCENGNLLNYLNRVRADQETSGNNFQALYSLLKFSVEIATGMEYISGKTIVHADLATRNVLLNERNVCKICDFGLSRSLQGNDCDDGEIYVKTGNDPLPWRWMAIESLKCNQFTFKSDVWSYGVTLWEIFTLGEVPYSGIFSCDGFEKSLEEGLRLGRPELAPIETWRIMESCWDTEPGNRPSFTSLVTLFRSLMRSNYDTI